MSDFGYVNARLRVMRSSRLRPQDYETLLGFGHIRELEDWLSTGPYSDAYGKAAEHAEGLKAADGAISERLRTILEACVKMVSHDTSSPLAAYLARNDYENIKVAIRAVLNGTGFEGAEQALVPLPPLDRGALQQLCGADSLDGIVRLLMTWGHPAGRALSRFLRLEGEVDLDKLGDLDRVLERTYYAEAVAVVLADDDDDNEPLRGAVRDEADLANLRAALKVAYGGGGELPSRPFSHGRVKGPVLENIASCRTLSDAVQYLEATVYRKALEGGAVEAARDGDLGGLERTIERVRLARLARGGTVDPVGIGFTLLFLAEAFLEAQNLRLAARAAAGIIPTELAQEAMIHV